MFQGPGLVRFCLSFVWVNQHTHFILVKTSLDRFLADCCSCSQCLRSDDNLEIKACHHSLINLKLSSFWFHSMPFCKPGRAANTVPGVPADSGLHPWKVGAGWALTLKNRRVDPCAHVGVLFQICVKGQEEGGHMCRKHVVCELQTQGAKTVLQRKKSSVFNIWKQLYFSYSKGSIRQ